MLSLLFSAIVSVLPPGIDEAALITPAAPQGFIGGGDRTDPAPPPPVPEPATLLLLGSGAVAVGVALYTRRRRKE